MSALNVPDTVVCTALIKYTQNATTDVYGNRSSPSSLASCPTHELSSLALECTRVYLYHPSTPRTVASSTYTTGTTNSGPIACSSTTVTRKVNTQTQSQTATETNTRPYLELTLIRSHIHTCTHPHAAWLNQMFSHPGSHPARATRSPAYPGLTEGDTDGQSALLDQLSVRMPAARRENLVRARARAQVRVRVRVRFRIRGVD